MAKRVGVSPARRLIESVNEAIKPAVINLFNANHRRNKLNKKLKGLPSISNVNLALVMEQKWFCPSNECKKLTKQMHSSGNCQRQHQIKFADVWRLCAGVLIEGL